MENKKIYGECSRCRRRYHVNKPKPNDEQLVQRTLSAIKQHIWDIGELEEKAFFKLLEKRLIIMLNEVRTQ